MARNTAVILLYNDDKKILLQKRTKDALRSPGKWGFFGGGMEAHEDSLTAVKRECLEELGYTLVEPRLVYQGLIDEHDEMYVYTEKYDPQQTLHLMEGDAMGWFTVDEVPGLDIIPHDREIILKIRHEIEKISS